MNECQSMHSIEESTIIEESSYHFNDQDSLIQATATNPKSKDNPHISPLKNLVFLSVTLFILFTLLLCSFAYFGNTSLKLYEVSSFSLIIQSQCNLIKTIIWVHHSLFLVFNYSLCEQIQLTFEDTLKYTAETNKSHFRYLKVTQSGLKVSSVFMTISLAILCFTSIKDPIRSYFEGVFNIDYFIVHAFITSILIYIVCFTNAILKNYLTKCMGGSMLHILYLAILLVLQYLLFYSAEIVYLFLNNFLESKSSEHHLSSKHLLMFSINFNFALFVITSQIIIVSSSHYFQLERGEIQIKLRKRKLKKTK